MSRYSQHVSPSKTRQTEQAREDQVANNAGGFVFALDKWAQLDRFLVLGAEGGTYYVSERKLSRDNAKAVAACIAEDGLRTVARIVAISDAGRAPKNDPAIFALAMCAGAKDPATRTAALAALPKVCRIGTHLFHFAPDVETTRRWGRGLRRAVASWYNDQHADALAMQAIKYQQRDGWGHKDMLRLAHPKGASPAHNAIYRWITAGADGVGQDSKLHAVRGRSYKPTPELPAVIAAFMAIHAPGVDIKQAVALIREHHLPHECVPNELKSESRIWEALLPHMGLTAMIRQLGKMTSVGLLKPMGAATKTVAATLTDTTKLFKARVHPMAVLIALKTYQQGHGFKGSLTWSPVHEIVDALDETFYLSFQAVEPTGARTLMGLDVSGSMGSPMGGSVVTCREATAAMAMVTARTEKNWHVMAFGNTFHELDISPKQRLDDVIRTIDNLPFQTTDCSLPLVYAMKKKLEVDAFAVYTDNETYAGDIHPYQALQQYRRQSGIAAKSVVVGMTASGFTIADPNDAGMLDVVGFDAAAPGVIADFVANREVQR